MRRVTLSLVLMCAAMSACTKRNPAVCCVTHAECEAAGFDSPAPCPGSNVCVENTCQATGCDGDEDCAAPLMCSANQCVQPADWTARHGGGGDDQAFGIAAASNGDLVMTGGFQGVVSFAEEPIVAAGIASPWVARYKADGRSLWSVELGDAGIGLGSAVAVDESGDVYAVGSFIGPANYGSGTSPFNGGSYVVKLSGSDGHHMWSRVIGPSPFVTAIAMLDSNHVAICGIFSDPADFGGDTTPPVTPGASNQFIAVYGAAEGDYIWAKALGTTSRVGESCALSVVDGDVLVSGDFQGTAMLGGAPLIATGLSDMFIARLHGHDGSHVWSTRHGGTGTTIPMAIAFEDGDIFVGGKFTSMTNLGGVDLNMIGTQDAFVAAYRTSDGAPVWSRSFGGTGAESSSVSLAATDNKLALAIKFSAAPLIVNSQSLKPHDGDIAITRLTPATGESSAASSQFTMSTSTPADSGISLSLVYTFNHLAGAGSFGGGAMLFGTSLYSGGKSDIASFRVDF